jgi:hypothetical protein
MKLMNFGSQKTYDLYVQFGGSGSSGKFNHTGITVPANSTHYIRPNWPDLHQSLKILEDVGNTGIITDSILVSNQTLGVKESPKQGIPRAFALEQNYPNPFNPSTTIRFQLPSNVNRNGTPIYNVTVRIFNVLGQSIATVVNGELGAGDHSVDWNAGSNASGIYYYRLDATNTADAGKSFTSVKKMILIK